jgi:hypothetical protein
MRQAHRPNIRGIDGVSGQPLDRRGFLQTAAKLLVTIPFFGFFSSSLLKSHVDLFQKARLCRDSSPDPVTVYKMVPLTGVKYDNAEIRHMANKIFPSIAAARARRPHRGFLYGLKVVPLPASLVNGMDGYTLFCNRKDFDRRVRTDQHHWQRLGVDVNAVLSVVKNA